MITAPPPKCVLVVEDDRSMCLGLSTTLQASGFRVFTAYDAVQGAMIVVHKKPDLALLDINMPAGGGFTIAECMRNTPETAERPIVFLTANTHPRTKLRAAELGAAEFLEKPLEVDLVLETVQRLLK